MAKFNKDGRLNLVDLYRLADTFGASKGYAAVWRGEYRNPKKGEWYLSGAVIEAYRAPNNLSSAYPIAAIVTIERQDDFVITGDA